MDLDGVTLFSGVLVVYSFGFGFGFGFGFFSLH